MEVIRLEPPETDGQTVSFAWTADPPTALYRTIEFEQVDLNAKAPMCGAFAGPSNGLDR